MKNIPKRIRDDELWKNVYALVEYMYGKVEDVITNFPKEEWTTASKLHSSAIDSLFYISQAVGNDAPEISRYDWSNARKYLFSLQTMYIFAAKQKFFELEPEVVVKIDNFLDEVDKRIAASKKEAEKKNKDELEPWLEKYRLWQKMHD